MRCERGPGEWGCATGGEGGGSGLDTHPPPLMTCQPEAPRGGGGRAGRGDWGGVGVWGACPQGRGVLNGKKKKVFRFPQKARGHSMCSTMVGGSWRLAVGGGWRLAVGSWQLAVGGGWWWLAAVGGWRLVVGGSWQWLAVGGWPPLAVGGGWWLAVGGGWQLMGVGGWRLVVPWGCT